MKELLSNWREMLPLAGLAVLAAVGIFFLLRRKPPDSAEIERQRRAYLNRVGRIVEGQVLEVRENAQENVQENVRDHAPDSHEKKRAAAPARHAAAASNGLQRLLYYTYSISGVTYETAQDITGLEERLHLTRVAAGQTASVKYDPSNPSNSILLADDWSGLH